MDGTKWRQLGSTVTIEMTDPIYLGLAVTSHVSGTCCTAIFDNLQTTDNTTGTVDTGKPTMVRTHCAEPTFSPVACTYTSMQSVTISTTTGGATIRYTTNGTTPSSTVGTVYSNPVNISSNTTLQAIAYESGYTNSTVASGVYTLNIPATYTTDTGTEGSWWSSEGYVYGSMGYVLCAWNNFTDLVSLNGSYVSSVTPNGQSDFWWAGASQANSAPINPATNTRAAACWYTSSNFTAQIALNNPNDGVAHRVAVYCLDWDNAGRIETVDLENPSTGTSLLSGGPVTVSSFSNGKWVVFTCYGNVMLKMTNTSGNAVISVIAFDNVSTPTCAAPTITRRLALMTTRSQ